MLIATNLGKQYKKRWAVEPLNLELGAGMYGLLGPNGAGKSTLMRLLAGILRPTTGSASLRGQPVLGNVAGMRQIGYVPQAFRLHPQLTAREWLMHAARIKGIPARLAPEAVSRVLDAVHLEAAADRAAGIYSSGMAKRLGIAQALIGDPCAIIVDEPTAGLDPEERVRLRNLLAEAALERIIIMSTHIFSDVIASCRQAIVLRDGALVYKGSLPELAACAEGKVWAWEASADEWRQFAAGPGILLSASKLPDGFLCRVLAGSQPSPFAMAVDPTSEDGYFALIGLQQEDGYYQ